MVEKRKSNRLPLKLELTISNLFKQDYELISDINQSINVVNISKAGLGFTCSHELPLDYYFDAKIQLTDDKFFYAVLKIVRIEKQEDRYFIGCEFVGLADILSQRVEMYETELKNN
ncbi:MAG: PilZ domain-containing protein [Bacillota bacterium]